MLRNILFRVHCIANRPDRVMSLRILLDWSHRPSVRTSIRVAKMPISMQYVLDTVDSKTDSIAHLSLSRSLLCVLVGYLQCWEQFWMDFSLYLLQSTMKKINCVFLCVSWCVESFVWLFLFAMPFQENYILKYRREIWSNGRQLTVSRYSNGSYDAFSGPFKFYRHQVQKPFEFFCLFYKFSTKYRRFSSSISLFLLR